MVTDYGPLASFVLIMCFIKTPKSNASIIKTITKKEIQTIINRDVLDLQRYF
jgi:hypothetical protein